MFRRSGMALLALLALLALPASTARADRASAAAHFEKAQAAERRGDYRLAIAEYELAHRDSPHPAVRYNLAAAHEKVGDLRSAADNYRRYLEEAGDASDRASVERRIDALRERPSTLSIAVDPADALVELDGRALASGVRDVEISAGPHRVRARRGGQSSERVVVAEYGEPLRVELRIERAPMAREVPPPTGGRWGQRVEYGAMSLGVLGLLYGGLYALEARKISQELSGKEGAWSSTDDQRYREGETAERRAWIVGGVGLGLVATSIAIRWLRPEPSERRPVAIAPSVGPSSVGVSVAAGF